jgi:hypothetical protein
MSRQNLVAAVYNVWLCLGAVVFYGVQGENENALQLTVLAACCRPEDVFVHASTLRRAGVAVL